MGMEGFPDPVELLVSEITTNAVCASATMTGPQRTTGRGLLLVETLSARWGCYAPEGLDRLGGKIVWALCTD